MTINKKERGLSFHEAAKMMGTSNVKLLEFLRERKILFVHRNRNVPYSEILKKGWFIVFEQRIVTDEYDITAPVVRLTELGYKKIKEMVYEDCEILNTYNNETFYLIFYKILSKRLSEFYIDLTLEKTKEYFRRYCITFNKRGTTTFIVFAYIKGERVKILTYNTSTKTINKNVGN